MPRATGIDNHRSEAMAKKRAAKSRAWNKGIKLGQKDAFTPDQAKRIRQVLARRGRTPQAKAAGPMRLVQGIGKRAWKMDCCVWQETRGLCFPRPCRRASSSDDCSANEPSAEKLDCRGGARPQEVRHRILTTHKGSPHLEWHRRYRDSPGALGPHEDRVHSALLTHRQEIRPDHYFSSLRYLISAHIQGRSRLGMAAMLPPVPIVRSASVSRPSGGQVDSFLSATSRLMQCSKR